MPKLGVYQKLVSTSKQNLSRPVLQAATSHTAVGSRQYQKLNQTLERCRDLRSREFDQRRQYGNLLRSDFGVSKRFSDRQDYNGLREVRYVLQRLCQKGAPRHSRKWFQAVL